MPSHSVFLAGFCLLLTHELDAIRCKEWRIFPFASALSDEVGYRTFTAVHFPLFFLLLWGLSGGASRGLMVALDSFAIIHLGLHLALRGRPEYGFRSAFSWSLIAGAALCGALDLTIRLP